MLEKYYSNIDNQLENNIDNGNEFNIVENIPKNENEKENKIQYKLDDFDQVPEDFICPVTLQLMVDPVICEDG